MKARAEAFGAIIALDEPPALLWVDREMAAHLGVDGGSWWDGPAPDARRMRAPTEVHVMTTNRCPAGCPGCYTSAVPEASDRPTAAWRATLEGIAELGVFHVALGGGESLLRTDLFELATYARELGLVPNLTTSGIGLSDEDAQRCRVFGQVNVSLDGVGDVYRKSRGYDGADVALRAMRRLVAAGVPTGINFVVSALTWDVMESTTAEVAALGGNEVEFLRYKPAGRARSGYGGRALNEAQARSLLPRLIRLSKQFPTLHIKADCSFVPFLCAADPDPAVLEQFGIYGCEAGHALAAVDAEGMAKPCSFLEDPFGPADDVLRQWDEHQRISSWREHSAEVGAPCSTCAYREICKGGCKVVSQYLGHPWFSPDPECPRVLAHRRDEAFRSATREEA